MTGMCKTSPKTPAKKPDKKKIVRRTYRKGSKA